MSICLSVKSVSKNYNITKNPPLTFKESLFRKIRGESEKVVKLRALHDITFSVERGQKLGIIGHNGAGKSTLLRLICGMGKPTTGSIERNGRVNGLLQLGAGFNSDLSGRENILTGGLLNGLTGKEIRQLEEEIISFAELEEFIDYPVRIYSSGMYLRLAFSTAIHFEPEIFVIDEILSVGDLRFQQKCIQKLRSIASSNNAIVLTSHDLNQIRTLCDEVIVLEEGQIVIKAPPDQAIENYHDIMKERSEKRAILAANKGTKSESDLERGNRLGSQEAKISLVGFFDKDGKEVQRILTGNSLTLLLEYSISNKIRDMSFTLAIHNELCEKCFEVFLPSIEATFGPLKEHGSFKCEIPEIPLLPGRYDLNLGLYPTNSDYIYDYHWQMHLFFIDSMEGSNLHTSGIVSLQPKWSLV